MDVSYWVSIGLEEDSRQVIALGAKEPGTQGGGHNDDEADDEAPTVAVLVSFQLGCSSVG